MEGGEDEQFGGTEFYKVRGDESLSAVSVKTGIAVSRLKSLNRSVLIGSERVLDGMILRLKTPAKHALSSPQSPMPFLQGAASSASFGSLESEEAVAGGGAGGGSEVEEEDVKHVFRKLVDPPPPAPKATLPDPVLLGKSPQLTVAHALLLRQFLPPTLQIENFVCLYSLRSDGADFNTFYAKVRGIAYTLMYVQTVANEVFGGFAGAEWKPGKDYYGSGESFLFKMKPSGGGAVGDEVSVYKWSQLNPYFQWSSMSAIAMGGEGDGFGFVLDADFVTGSSNHCKTYNNPILTEEPGVIRISSVEVWGFSRYLRKGSGGGGASPRAAARKGAT